MEVLTNDNRHVGMSRAMDIILLIGVRNWDVTGNVNWNSPK